MKMYQAQCLKEIYWNGRSCRQGETIRVEEEDMRTLSGAGVIGNIRLVTISREGPETQMSGPPENAAMPRGRRKAQG